MPVCGNKSRDRIREDTVLKNYPLYCPKCRRETLIEAETGGIENNCYYRSLGTDLYVRRRVWLKPYTAFFCAYRLPQPEDCFCCLPGRCYYRLTSFCQCLQSNLRITMDLLTKVKLELRDYILSPISTGFQSQKDGVHHPFKV